MGGHKHGGVTQGSEESLREPVSNGSPSASSSSANRLCTVADCANLAIAKGLCSKHYDRMRRYGTTEIPARPSTCTVDDCENAVRAKGLCNMHYKRLSRYGTTAPRDRNTHCTVDGCDRPHLAKGLCRFHYDQQRRSSDDDT